ncbi:MAG: stage III sporulation protein AD [Eubacterium sp.]|nr:stage III sporulation protein AD [Eubacterium sp.]
MITFKIALAGVLGALLAVIAGQARKEYGIIVLLGLALVMNGFLVSRLREILTFLDGVSQKVGISDTYLRLLYKLLGISFVSRISSGLCEDMGYKSVAYQIELAGKLSILILSIPMLNSLFEMMDQVL